MITCCYTPSDFADFRPQNFADLRPKSQKNFAGALGEVPGAYDRLPQHDAWWRDDGSQHVGWLGCALSIKLIIGVEYEIGGVFASDHSGLCFENRIRKYLTQRLAYLLHCQPTI